MSRYDIEESTYDTVRYESLRRSGIPERRAKRVAKESTSSESELLALRIRKPLDVHAVKKFGADDIDPRAMARSSLGLHGA